MDDCIFCRIVEGKVRSWKVFENNRVLAFFDINPVNEYHTLVIPKNHYVNIFEIPENELLEVMKVVKRLAIIFNNKLGINNVQIINCSGVDAQQDVFHAHFHIVPRKKGDQNDVKWKTHPEWVGKFDRLLEKVK